MNHPTPEGWNTKDTCPNDGVKVEVIDQNGIIASGYATWYPFKVGKRNGGKWTNTITHCDPYWDGGWMIESGGLASNFDEVVGWRHIDEF